MSDSLRNIARLASVTIATAIGMVACRHEPPPIAPPPALPQQQLAIPAPAASAPRGGSLLVEHDTAGEPHVDVDTHGAEVDVRPLLDFVGRAGGFTLLFPPNLNRRVRIQMLDVPVSVALESLLAIAQLQLESATPGGKLPTTPSVVFYELPVNVDSLSADAIAKRFGVSKSIADLIVQSRTAGRP